MGPSTLISLVAQSVRWLPTCDRRVVWGRAQAFGGRNVGRSDRRGAESASFVRRPSLQKRGNRPANEVALNTRERPKPSQSIAFVTHLVPSMSRERENNRKFIHRLFPSKKSESKPKGFVPLEPTSIERREQEGQVLDRSSSRAREQNVFTSGSLKDSSISEQTQAAVLVAAINESPSTVDEPEPGPPALDKIDT
jgi:hypothetical protein